MKQALTAGGTIAVWYESAKLAFYRLEIDFKEDRTLPALRGSHPEYGEIFIQFIVPVQGKTRMEITVQDAALIAEFKKIVVPAFKYVSKMSSEKKETEAKTQTVAADSTENNANRTAVQKTVEHKTENSIKTADADRTEKEASQAETAPSETKPEVRHCKYCQTELQAGDKICPKCGKRQNKGMMIAGIAIGLLILGVLIGFAAYKLIKGQDSGSSQTSTVVQDNSNNSSDTTENSSEKTIDQSQLVSLDQYNQVEKGMSYAQVCSVMGREGTFLEPEAQVTDENGEAAILRTYYWEAQGPQGANVCVTFQNDAVATVSQYGLK